MAVNGWQVLNGERTYLDLNGDPLSGGSVWFYIPGTTTPNTTWVDENLTVSNTNPVLLDQAGRATIWGQGLYRQIVQDQFGNVQWDLTTGAEPGFKDLEAESATITNLTATNATIDNLTTTISTHLTNLVITAAPGQTDAFLVTSSVQINGDIAYGGCLRAVPGVTTGINTCDSLTIQASPNQLDALITNGDVQINGADGASHTYMTGRVITLTGTNPGVVLSDANSALSYIMWEGSNELAWGLAGAGWQPANQLMALNSVGQVAAAGFNVSSDENLKRDIGSLNVDCMNVVRRVKTKKYKLLVDDEKEYWGFTAQDMSEATDGGMGAEGTLSVVGMISVLWKALQEIDHQLVMIRSQISTVGMRVTAMEQDIVKMKAMLAG